MKVVVDELESRWRGVRPIQTHSVVLMVAGLVYVAIGFTYLTANPTPSRIQSLKYALNWLSYNDWGFVFILVGALSILSSRWPPVSETWGYFVLTGQSSAWALFYAAGVIFGNAPSSNLAAVLSWGLIGFMWWAISRLANPEIVKKLLGRILELQHENLALHDEIHRIRENRE